MSASSELSCPVCGTEFELVWAVSLNMQEPPPGMTALGKPEQRDIGRCNTCDATFERSNGGPWTRQATSSET